MEARYRAVMQVVVDSMKDRERVVVYSPICHNHPIAQIHRLPTDWEFWSQIDFPMIERCDRLVVVQLEGWMQSVGVAAEIDLASRLRKPVLFIERWEDYWRCSDYDEDPARCLRGIV